MAIWRVKATWIEDDAEASEQWDVNAATAHAAVQEVTSRLRFQPHYVEARRQIPEGGENAALIDLAPGQVRRIPPQ